MINLDNFLKFAIKTMLLVFVRSALVRAPNEYPQQMFHGEIRNNIPKWSPNTPPLQLLCDKLYKIVQSTLISNTKGPHVLV